MRVMTWNIAEGKFLGHGDQPENSQLGLIAQRIREQNPDLVFLNECKNWNWPYGNGVHQVAALAAMTGLHFQWVNTVATFLTGHKAVAVLSRWPLWGTSAHPLPNGFAIMRTHLFLDGLTYVLFSLRFAPGQGGQAEAEQTIGLAHLAGLVSAVPAGIPIIAAGDFNCGFVDGAWQPHFMWFAQNSGLRRAPAEQPHEQPDPSVPPCGWDRILDFIFFRGPHRVVMTRRECPDPHPSDHPYEVADLQFTRNEDWTHGPFYGNRGTFFVDLTGDGRADAIAVSDGTVTVRRNHGGDFGPDPGANEDWTHGPCYGERATVFADVSGDGRPDIILVSDDTVTVRRNTGHDFGAGPQANEDWTHGPFYGNRGTFFVDLTGDGRADAIAVSDGTVTVRRNHGGDFGPDPGANEDWTHGQFYGERGTFFADLTGDRAADILAVNDGTVTARRNAGSRFGA
jgi:endonuclease/exonuclease/phosphatase family metal-dependent hydrolase